MGKMKTQRYSLDFLIGRHFVIFYDCSTTGIEAEHRVERVKNNGKEWRLNGKANSWKNVESRKVGPDMKAKGDVNQAVCVFLCLQDRFMCN